MASRGRNLLWIWLIATIVLDYSQFLLLPGNKFWWLSLLFGLPTFGAAVAIPIEFSRIWSDPSRSAPSKLAWSVLMFVGLSAIVCLAGIFTLFSHLQS
jgi:hypothetical protein